MICKQILFHNCLCSTIHICLYGSCVFERNYSNCIQRMEYSMLRFYKIRLPRLVEWNWISNFHKWSYLFSLHEHANRNKILVSPILNISRSNFSLHKLLVEYLYCSLCYSIDLGFVQVNPYGNALYKLHQGSTLGLFWNRKAFEECRLLNPF